MKKTKAQETMLKDRDKTTIGLTALNFMDIESIFFIFR